MNNQTFNNANGQIPQNPNGMGENKKKDKKTMWIVIGSSIATVVVILASFCTWIVVTAGGGNLKELDVFEYVYEDVRGIEGNASVTLNVNSYSLEKEYSEDVAKEIKDYIKNTTFIIEGKEIPVIAFDPDSDENSYNQEPQVFDWDVETSFVLEIDNTSSYNKEHGYEPKETEKTIELYGSLDIKIESTDEVSKEKMIERAEEFAEYVYLGYDLDEDFTEVEEAIEAGEATQVAIYYRLDEFKSYQFTDYDEVVEPNSFTLVTAYEYKGAVYVFGETGMNFSGYSTKNKKLSYATEMIKHTDFEFEKDENKLSSIDKAMKDRGYTKLA